MMYPVLPKSSINIQSETLQDLVLDLIQEFIDTYNLNHYALSFSDREFMVIFTSLQALTQILSQTSRDQAEDVMAFIDEAEDDDDLSARILYVIQEFSLLNPEICQELSNFTSELTGLDPNQAPLYILQTWLQEKGRQLEQTYIILKLR